MEGLTRLVTESLARHGFDRPLDYRRLHWSRWFRCESHHSLLFVPSRPGVFALAEEVMDLSDVTTAASAVPQSEASGTVPEAGSRKPEAGSRRMLAVTQFFEDDDMAFVLDRMLSSQNPMRARLTSGRYFVRYVIIEDQSQRRSICAALNQWMASAAEKATGIGADFATSLELTHQSEYAPPTHVGADAFVRPAGQSPASLHLQPEPSSNPSLTPPQPDSGAATNIHCPTPFPSGF